MDIGQMLGGIVIGIIISLLILGSLFRFGVLGLNSKTPIKPQITIKTIDGVSDTTYFYSETKQ